MILKELNIIEDKAAKLVFIKANKAEILKAKKAIIKIAPPTTCAPILVKSLDATKAANNNDNIFEIVGNSVGFMDHHDDVSIEGSFNKTVKEAGQLAPILINHNHTPAAIFGKNLGVEVKQVSIKSLGYDAKGTTEALTAKIAPIYDLHMKNLYDNGEIKQHSIGLQYVKLELAINDKDDAQGFANWNKYLPQVINNEKAEKNGYFFAVIEQKLIEISAVLFGSNPFTPTLDDNKSIEPSDKDTQQTEPPQSTQNSKSKTNNFLIIN